MAILNSSESPTRFESPINYFLLIDAYALNLHLYPYLDHRSLVQLSATCSELHSSPWTSNELWETLYRRSWGKIRGQNIPSEIDIQPSYYYKFKNLSLFMTCNLCSFPKSDIRNSTFDDVEYVCGRCYNRSCWLF